MHPRQHAAVTPDKPAAVMAESGEVRSYAALEQVANQGAQLLRVLGLHNDDTIALWLPNCLEYFDIYWAAQRAGLYIVPISTALTAEEAGYILADCGAILLVTCAEVKHAADFLAQYQNLAPALRHLFAVGETLTTAASWEKARAAMPATRIADEQAGFHMVYSSGTTGRPKGVRIPLTSGPAEAPHFLAEQQQARYGTGPATVFYSPAPLYHTAPLAFSTSAQRLGATVVLAQKFDPEAALAAIETYRATHTQMVPTMFIRLLRLADDVRQRYDISSLTHVVHAAAPCPVPVKQQMLEWLGPVIYEYYGGSEGNGMCFITPQEWQRKPGSVGRAIWGTLHVCGSDGTELPPGEAGEVYFEGGWDFQYLNDDAKSASARNPLHPRWTTIGDIGFVDEDGYLFLTDRKNFMIISGGVNIYPQEAENLLAAHPKVQDAAVFGIPDAEMGEAVHAAIQPMDWTEATPALAAELIAYCRENLSHIKCPRGINFVAEFPRHDTGKLYKRKLRDAYWPKENTP